MPASVPTAGHGDHPPHDEDDACLCDIKIADDEVSADSDLPEAYGGVEVSSAANSDTTVELEGDHEHGLPDASLATPDEGLPMATGGVG